jgi:hypothetical protein
MNALATSSIWTSMPVISHELRTSISQLTIPNILTLENLKSLSTLQDSLGKKWNLDASCLDGTLADAMYQRRRNNCSGNLEFLLSCKDGNIDIAMHVVLDWE